MGEHIKIPRSAVSKVSLDPPRSAPAPFAAAPATVETVEMDEVDARARFERADRFGHHLKDLEVSDRGGLPGNLRAGMERLSGLDLRGVRVHYGSPKPAQLQALAYAQGKDIHLAPGQEEHLPHEAWHVVQQKRGLVKPTLRLGSMEINDDSALEKEASDMGTRAAAMKVDMVPPARDRDSEPEQGVVQGWFQINGKEYRKKKDIDRAELQDAEFKLSEGVSLEKAIDRIEVWADAEDDKGQLDETWGDLIERAAKEVAHEQSAELGVGEHPEEPYRQMTKEGILWSHPDYEHNVENTKKEGKEYFKKLSDMNRLDLVKKEKERFSADNFRERHGISSQSSMSGWYSEFVKRAEKELKNSVVNHYTTEARANLMAATGGMKSKRVLEKENPDAKHNTSGYDEYGLANSGFLFFFIEPPNAPMRKTRFAKGSKGEDEGGAARISIPIEESGLLANGWIMLSDFAQREYPDIMTKEKPGRKATLVRKFTQGAGTLGDEELEALSAEEKDPTKRQAKNAVTTQVRGDQGSKQEYYSKDNKFKIAVPDRIFNNILVGPDIIPGLATRAALEVARIDVVNPGLAKSLKKLMGDKLMEFMLKDLFRPQAMIPNKISISEKDIQKGK